MTDLRFAIVERPGEPRVSVPSGAALHAGIRSIADQSRASLRSGVGGQPWTPGACPCLRV